MSGDTNIEPKDETPKVEELQPADGGAEKAAETAENGAENTTATETGDGEQSEPEAPQAA